MKVRTTVVIPPENVKVVDADDWTAHDGIMVVPFSWVRPPPPVVISPASSASPSSRSPPPPPSCTPPATPRPPPEPTGDLSAPKGFVSKADYEPLSEQERYVRRRFKSYLSHSEIPPTEASENDWLNFQRGYEYASEGCVYEAFRSMLLWRQRRNIDSIAHDVSIAAPRMDEFDEMCPSCLLGEDTTGHPVALDNYTHVSSRVLLSSFGDEEFVTHMIARKELQRTFMKRTNQRLGSQIYRVITVVDVGGIDSGHLRGSFLSRFKMVNACFGSNYPESVWKLVIINAPMLFRLFWNLIKPFLNPVTAAKVSVVGGDVTDAFREYVLREGVTIQKGKIAHDKKTWGSFAANVGVTRKCC